MWMIPKHTKITFDSWKSSQVQPRITQKHRQDDLSWFTWWPGVSGRFHPSGNQGHRLGNLVPILVSFLPPPSCGLSENRAQIHHVLIITFPTWMDGWMDGPTHRHTEIYKSNIISTDATIDYRLYCSRSKIFPSLIYLTQHNRSDY